MGKRAESTQKMVRMRLSGKTHDEIAEAFGITRQAVQQRLKPFKISVSKRYSLGSPESSQNSESGRVRDILKDIYLKARKFF